MRAARLAGVAVLAATGAAGLWATVAPREPTAQRADLLCTWGYVGPQSLPPPTCSDFECNGIATGPTGVSPFFDVYACSDDL